MKKQTHSQQKYPRDTSKNRIADTSLSLCRKCHIRLQFYKNKDRIFWRCPNCSLEGENADIPSQEQELEKVKQIFNYKDMNSCFLEGIKQGKAQAFEDINFEKNESWLIGHRIGKQAVQKKIIEILTNDDLDWGSHIKGSGKYLYFDSKAFLEIVLSKFKEEK